MPRAVLIIEDEAILAKNIKAYLERLGYEAAVAASGEEGLAKLETFQPDMVLLDYHLPQMNGLETLAKLRSRDPGRKVIMLTGHGNVEIAVQAMKAGACDYLAKPVALSELRLVIDKAIGQEQLEQTLNYLQAKEASAISLESLLGESPPMTKLKQMARRMIEAEYTLADNAPPAVLITGETGTGKEVIARAIHFEGPRKSFPFIELNCASIPPHLLEAELFGYERGAFTDARERKHGLFEAADGGTLFLDEIGETERPFQTKLLKVLEDRKVRRLGGLRENFVNFRLIAATNQDLERHVQEGRFRADLYYRLRTVHLEPPPLRMRGADILLLARSFLAMQGARYRKPGLRFTAGAEQALLDWPWLGNVRELRNTIEHTVLMAHTESIDRAQIAFSQIPSPARVPVSAQDGLNLGALERDCMLMALRKTGWNVTRAARELGLSRDTLRYRMEKYDLRSATG